MRLLIVLALALCVVASPFTDVLVELDCDGTLHFPSLNDAAVQIRGLPQAFSVFQESLIEQMTYACPALTDDDVEKYFKLPQALINYVTGGDLYINKCPSLTPIVSIFFQWYQRVNIRNMPASCSRSTYAQSGCSLSIDFPDGMTSGTFMMKQCPTTSFPSFTLSATGPLLQNLFKPCDTDMDCPASGLSCQDLTKNLDTSFFNQWLQQYFYTPCGSFSDFVSTFRSFWSSFYSLTKPVGKGLSICAPHSILSDISSVTALLPPALSSYSYIHSWLDITLPTLKAGPALSAIKQQTPFVPKYPSCTGELSIDCDGNAAVNMGERVAAAARIPFLPQLEKTVFSWLRSAVAECMQGSFSEESFLVNYAPWSLQGYLARLAAGTNPVIIQQSPVGQILPWYSIPPVVMPTGCTYSDFVKTGKCEAKFSAFSSLLQTTKLDVYLGMQQCPSTNQTSIKLNLVGPLSSFLATPTTCSTSPYCSDGLVCTDVSSFSPDVWRAFNYRSYAPSSSAVLIANYLMGTSGVNQGVLYCLPQVNAIANGWVQWGLATAFTSYDGTVTLASLTSGSYTCPTSIFASYLANTEVSTQSYYGLSSGTLTGIVAGVVFVAVAAVLIGLLVRRSKYVTLREEMRPLSA